MDFGGRLPAFYGISLSFGKVGTMIFPIGDDNVVGGYKPYFSYLFLGLNILVFLVEVFVYGDQIEAFFNAYGARPASIMAGENLLSLFTSIFVHGGWMHLIGNMLFLWVFADNIEAVIGNISFFIFYMLGGIFASFIHILFNLGSTIPSVGASGAIAAVMGAYLVMFPKSRIKVLVFIKVVYVSALIFLGLWIVGQLFSGFAAIGDTAQTHEGGVAWWAHIGGFVFGVLAGYFYKSRNLQYEYRA